MKTSIVIKRLDHKNYIKILVNDREYSFIITLKHNFDLSRPKYIAVYTEIIQICYDELLLLEYTPKEIKKKINNRFFDLNIFMSISFIVFKKEFTVYISKFVTDHIENKNFEFNDFYIDFLNKKWLYIPNEYFERQAIKKFIKAIFDKKVELFRRKLCTYITKNEEFTPEVHIWDIKYQNKYFKEIRFNIPNSKVRSVIYDNKKFNNFIKEIESSLVCDKTLKNFKDADGLFVLLSIIISVCFIDEFRLFVKESIKKLINNCIVVNIINLKKEIFLNPRNKTVSYILSINRIGNKKAPHYSNIYYYRFATVLYDEVKKGYAFQLQNRVENNLKQADNSNGIFTLLRKNKNDKVHSIRIDFSEFILYDIIYEFKDYLKWIVKNDKDILTYFDNVFILFFNFFKDIFEAKSFSSYHITPDLIQKFSLSLLTNDSKITIKTIKSKFYKIKSFFNYIVKNKISNNYNLPQLEENPLVGIKFKNIEKYTNHFKPLPEEVYFKILNYSNFLSPIIRNAFIILSSTGFRWSELISLTEKSLYKKNGIYFLKVIESKQETSRLKKGKSLYRHVAIYDDNVIKVILEQIKNSKLIENNELIFKRRNQCFLNEEFNLVSNSSYNEAINILIKKFNIVDETGVLWKYSSHQMRVRIATLMAENGYESQDIASFLNHASTQTINKAYAFVRKKKMTELNTNFFKEHFNYLIPSKNLKRLTKEDREQLYVKLYINHRQMEYGKCVLPIDAGDCGKLQESCNCASCIYLVTSKSYVIKWKEFYNNQKNRIIELESIYKNNNIKKEEYIDYPEYSREVFYLESYVDIIKKLEN